MYYRVIIYIIVVFLSAYAISGVNLNGIFKKGKVIEANMFVFLLILALSELVTSFIINFLEVSKIL